MWECALSILMLAEPTVRFRTLADGDSSQSCRSVAPVGAHRVLVAEDDLEMRRLMRLLLERGGFTVAEAGDGQEALDLAVTIHPEILVTDLCMPRRDGRDLVLALRAQAEFAHLPILVLTGSPGHPAVAELGGIPHLQVMQKLPMGSVLAATLTEMLAACQERERQPLLAS